MKVFDKLKLRRGALAVVVAVAGTAGLAAFAQPAPGGPDGGGPGWHHERHERSEHGGGPMMMPGGPMLQRMLDDVDATTAQRGQIKQILRTAQDDIRTQREAGKGLHEKAMQLFTQPTVDAAAAESLRQQMEAQHDQGSKRMLQAMLDVSKVLTPDQRAKLGERMKKHHEMMEKRMDRHAPASAPAR